jgi:hypothetical protein
VFPFLLIGFTYSVGSFILNNYGSFEFRITQFSKAIFVFFFIQTLGFGFVFLLDKNLNILCFCVRVSFVFLHFIPIFRGSCIHKKKIFHLNYD